MLDKKVNYSYGMLKLASEFLNIPYNKLVSIVEVKTIKDYIDILIKRIKTYKNI